MKQEAIKRAQPLAVYLELTFTCNWRCVFCYNPRHFDLRRMNGDEWIAVLDDLRFLGTLTVTLTGGEPLTHPEFFRIARAARERALAVRIFTNGALIDQSVARDIAALDPQGVEISIHGATADVHDAATGKPGSFDAMWRGIENLRRNHVRVFIKAPLTKINEHQLDDLERLVVDEAGLSLNVDPAITPRDDGDSSPLQYAPSADAIRRLMHKPRVYKSLQKVERVPGWVNCGLGRITLSVDPEGNVFPCIQWKQTTLGNVRTTPLREIWTTSTERAEVAQVSNRANDRMIEMGGAMGEFSFCPAIALQKTGNPYLPDPVVLQQAEIAAEIRSELSSK